MSTFTDSTARYGRFWYAGLAGLWLLALFLRWPYPEPAWIHIDERIFLLHPLKLWSGDLNPHFFIYPTLHIYLTSILYYLYYLCCHSAPLEDFVAYYFFVDGSGLIEVARCFNTLLSAATAVVVAAIGRRLYGMSAGVLAGLFFAALPLSVRFAHLATTDTPAALWITCALFFAVRMAQEGRIRDCVWAGVCVGLAGGTKYPAALAGVPVAAAGLLYWPTLRHWGGWVA
ncbi:MAG TPA: phospholipid carrier-dependent glycosyltransferase, partial [Candidatus Latescibacteria bacterium]|nr:phospholipid carrier-dependent glycosyltransferase [Candidatus Latescibacterota bacterium]